MFPTDSVRTELSSFTLSEFQSSQYWNVTAADWLSDHSGAILDCVLSHVLAGLLVQFMLQLAICSRIWAEIGNDKLDTLVPMLNCDTQYWICGHTGNRLVYVSQHR